MVQRRIEAVLFNKRIEVFYDFMGDALHNIRTPMRLPARNAATTRGRKPCDQPV